MSHLIYYQTEKEEFKEAWAIKFSVAEADIIVPKIMRHYKILPQEKPHGSGGRYFYFTSGNRHALFDGHTITLNVDWLNLGEIAHEVAHAIDYKKCQKKGMLRKSWHNKRHRRIMGKVIAYCLKRDNWKAETTRRLRSKESKPSTHRMRSSEHLLFLVFSKRKPKIM